MTADVVPPPSPKKNRSKFDNINDFRHPITGNLISYHRKKDMVNCGELNNMSEEYGTSTGIIATAKPRQLEMEIYFHGKDKPLKLYFDTELDAESWRQQIESKEGNEWITDFRTDKMQDLYIKRSEIQYIFLDRG